MKHRTSHWHPDAVDSDAASSSSGVGRTSSAPALLRKQCPACGERYPAHFLVCPSDATQLQEASSVEVDPLIGAVLAETYEVRRVIGEGGMGRVYEARHTRLLSKRFAIKVLHGDLTRQPEVVDRFLREAEATSALHHPNIVGVLDVNQLPDGRPYIVAELLEGQQLGDYFERRGQLTSEEAVAICRPICHALMAAHGKDIVHRDIKPENLFLVGEGAQRTVKVLDFGISRVGDAAGSKTKTGMILGTPAYMPPEQARGQRVDHRADIYAVGAILYEAVTGKAPFESDDPIATLGAVLTESPVSPRSFAANLPAGLELVIQKAMAKSADDRYASMQEFDAALAEFDGGPHRNYERPSYEPSAEHESGMRGRLRRWYVSNAPELARKRMWLLSIATVSFLFAALLALSVNALRLSRSGATPTNATVLVCALASAAVLSVPFILWANFLFWHVSLSTSRVLDISARNARVLSASLYVYAGGMLLVRVLGAQFASPSRLAWPGWDLIVIVFALICGGAMAWLEWKPRSR